MKGGEHREIAGAVFEHMVEIPDLEMVAHADEKRPLDDVASRAHPRRDQDAALTVEAGRCDEPEGPSLRRLFRRKVVVG